MSASADAKTPGGYGDTSTAASGDAPASGGNWWQTMVGNAVNRYMDVETWKQTQGQMPPQYYTGGQAVRSQYLNTGTVTNYGAQAQSLLSNPLVIVGALVAVYLIARK